MGRVGHITSWGLIFLVIYIKQVILTLNFCHAWVSISPLNCHLLSHYDYLLIKAILLWSVHTLTVIYWSLYTSYAGRTCLKEICNYIWSDILL